MTRSGRQGAGTIADAHSTAQIRSRTRRCVNRHRQVGQYRTTPGFENDIEHDRFRVTLRLCDEETCQ